MIRQGSTKERRNFWCIHHGDKTRNDRGLSATVERDPNDEKIIISSRKRDDTHSWARRCRWRCYLIPFVEMNESGTSERWVLRYGMNRETTLPTTSHSHSFAANPFIYPKHRTSHPSYVQALPQAVTMRNSSLSFRQAERILYGQGLKLDRNAYYNLARDRSMEPTQDGLLALVAVLERDN